MVIRIHSRARRRAFTLIELLMVLAIIGVLAVVALPILQKYRQRAFDASAISDISQFRNAVVNTETPVAFTVNDTNGPHSNFADVKISPKVHVMSVSGDFAGGDAGWMFYAYSCHENGENGYFISVPYGGVNVFDWIVPNQIYISAVYRPLAGCNP